MLILNILDILKKYTDEVHRLSQKDIIIILENEYQMKADRKSIKRNLENLKEYGYNIECSEKTRINNRGEEEIITTDYYLDRDFTNSELRLLIDSVLFSKQIPYNQRKDLIKKVEGLSNKYFSSKVKYISTLPEKYPENKSLFYNIEILDEAISNKKQVSFKYNYFDTDKKMHPRLNDDNTPKDYIINPYQMVAANGRYYLICNYDKYDNVSNFRIDRISDIKLLNTASKPQQNIKGLEEGLNLPKHMAEHIYMFSGESGRVSFCAKRYILNDIFDWFGSDIRFTDETTDEVTVSVVVNFKAMHWWAMQYAPHIKLLSPESLVKSVAKDLADAVKKYIKN